MKSRKKAAKATAPPQALFDSMDGEASPDASSSEPSAADVIAETDGALAEAEAQEASAYATATVEREEAAILETQQAIERAVSQPEPLGVAGDAFDEEGGDVDDEGGSEEESSVDQEQQQPTTLQNKSTMDPTALVFMEDAMARRLAVAWPVCKGDEDQWFDAAGFTPKQRAEALRIGRALRLNGICRDGGTTDPLAIEYIQAVIVKPLNAARGKTSAPAKAK
jgi:hypothetical protein